MNAVTRRTFLEFTGATAVALRPTIRALADAPRSQHDEEPMDIKRSGSQPSGKGPTDWFTGAVRIDPLFRANARHTGLVASRAIDSANETARPSGSIHTASRIPSFACSVGGSTKRAPRSRNSA
jgi:hypothetical protein